MAVTGVIPWKEILRHLPTVVVTARELWSHWASRPKSSSDPQADVKTQLVSVTKRLEALESIETEQSKLLSQMAEQLEAIARRAAIAYWLGVSGVVFSCAAVLVAVFR